MNTKDLLKVLKSKDRLSHIHRLLKDKKYDEIYSSYGQTIYTLVVPRKYKKQDINKLFSEGKFEDIYHKYGKSTYNSLLAKMREAEVYYETGSKPKSFFSKITYLLKHQIAPLFLSATLLLPPVTITTFNVEGLKDVKENSITYAEEIEKYNKQIEEYAKSVKELNLTDLQIIMKVMSDMWEKIDGYGDPKETIFGYERLSFLEDPSVGVCQHMADDTTAILNEINPDFHARNLTVYMSYDAMFNLADIDRTVIDTDEQENESDENSNTLIENIVDNSIEFIGNHVVTVIDMPKEKLTLIVDPTNPGIGIYKDGKIHMFSSKDGTGISPKPLSNIMFRGSSIFETAQTFMNTFIEPDKSIEELSKIYGTDALNEVLKEIKEIEKSYNPSEEITEAKTSFDERYKINSSLLPNLEDSKTTSESKKINVSSLDNQDIR